MTNLEKDVLDAIKNHGKLKNKEIRRLLFLKYGRISGARIREVIHSLRVKKHAIISDSKGYWLSDNTKEIYDCVKNLKKRSEKIEDAASGLESCIK